MYQLFETICIRRHEIRLLHYHQTRMQHAYHAHYFKSCPFMLMDIIDPQALPSDWIKCHVSYNETTYDVSYAKYEKRPIEELILTQGRPYYPFKYTDRTALQQPIQQVLTETQDALFIDGTRLIETTYCNIALRIDQTWLSPLYPSFHGVQRQYLLDQGQLQLADLHLLDLANADQIILFNAMMSFEEKITIWCK